MNPAVQGLEAVFGSLSDEELLARCAAGSLTEEAQAAARKEARQRGLNPIDPSPVVEESETYLGDRVIVARYLTPTEAHLCKSCLEGAGIPAEVGDANLLQANELLFSALGGASLRVPEAFVAEAKEVLAAVERGDFALDEGFDPDDA